MRPDDLSTDCRGDDTGSIHTCMNATGDAHNARTQRQRPERDAQAVVVGFVRYGRSYSVPGVFSARLRCSCGTAMVIAPSNANAAPSQDTAFALTWSWRPPSTRSHD